MNLFACQMQAGYIWISDCELCSKTWWAAQAFYGLFKIPLKCSILNELETCKGLILNILKGQEHGVRQIDSTIYSNMIWC